MKLHLRKSLKPLPLPNPNEYITLDIDVKSIQTVVENCNVGEGTLSNPINVDSFTSYGNLKADFPEFKPGEIINLDLDDESGSNVELVCWVFKNIGKKNNENSATTIGLFKSVFDCEVKSVEALIDGSLCIMPDSKTSAKLSVNSTKGIKPTQTFYFSYSIVFSMKVEIGGENVLKFFRIDPVVKVEGEEYPN